MLTDRGHHVPTVLPGDTIITLDGGRPATRYGREYEVGDVYRAYGYVQARLDSYSDWFENVRVIG